MWEIILPAHEMKRKEIDTKDMQPDSKREASKAGTQTLEIPIRGMDCVECTRHVERAISGLPGVESVEVLLGAERAVVRLHPDRVGMPDLRKAVEKAGYSVPAPEATTAQRSAAQYARRILTLLFGVFAVLLFVVVLGEWLGLLESVSSLIPWQLGVVIILIGGYPVFLNVLRAAWRREIIAHTLMTMGVIAAVIVGEWATAAVVVFFMRVGDFVERYTAERARHAIRDLTSLSPQKARLLRQGEEVEVPIEEVNAGDVVVVRPGEKIPVDGEVVAGQATVNQATITGESMPVEAEAGSQVYAATIATLGNLRIRAQRIGSESTFGRVIKLVEAAESQRGRVQRAADRFSSYFLPLVAGIAALTFIIGRDPLATAAVLVVACSCSFALATPIAMLASIGASARRGLLIKGGKHLEALARAQTVLIDKTGTLTLGEPEVTGVIPLGKISANELLSLAASAERYSEHPLGEAVRLAAFHRGCAVQEPQNFEATPGIGVLARIDSQQIGVGNRRSLPDAVLPDSLLEKEKQGETLLVVTRNGELIGALAAADTLRDEVPQAINQLKRLGIDELVLISGDNKYATANLADRLGVDYRAELLPEDKIEIVRRYQERGRTVVMIGDGVNDAPSLAQADVGIAMGAVGSDVAIEAAHIALLREDWTLVPLLFRIARRTMSVVKLNIGFTLIYNLFGLSLAALGVLPPILAAAAQSIPDLGILANSSRLLQQGKLDQ